MESNKLIPAPPTIARGLEVVLGLSASKNSNTNELKGDKDSSLFSITSRLRRI
jgi:hypothetical protein